MEWERHKGRWQEEKKKEAVKTNKSKTRPVSNGRCRVQAGVLKALHRVIWSLIFLGFGVHLSKAEEQGSQVKQRIEKISVKCPEEWRSDGRGCTLVRIGNGNGMREVLVKNKKKRETARVRTPGPLTKKCKVVTSVP